jgi:hypothetical protein
LQSVRASAAPRPAVGSGARGTVEANMKRVLSLALLGAFVMSVVVGCHASVDTDHPDTDTSYKKTTTYDNGTKTTKTETKVEH